MNTPHFLSSAGSKLFSGASWLFTRFVMCVVMLCVTTGVALAQDDDDDNDQDHERGACSRTADATFRACQHEIQDDYWIAMAKCKNLSDPQARAECREEAKRARQESKELCREQLEARSELCEALGEGPYDPQIDPALFVDPAEIGKTVAPNPYYPLIRGMTRLYRGGAETVTVTVTEDTKVILGVACAVIRDVVEENGEVIEDTKDWYAHDIFGNVWYFGESVKDFADGELVSIAGSFTAGVDGDKAGIIMKAAPVVGEVYRQEFSLSNAEDMAEFLSLTGSATVPAGSFNGNSWVTKEFSPIEPGSFATKYYAPGIGSILEVSSTTGARLELVEVRGGPANLPNAATSAEHTNKETMPARFGLAQNFPNPFNPTTEIRFELKQSGRTTLTVFNALGQQVATLVDGDLPAGTHRVTFESSSLPAGVYLYQLEAGGLKEVHKMVLVK